MLLNEILRITLAPISGLNLFVAGNSKIPNIESGIDVTLWLCVAGKSCGSRYCQRKKRINHGYWGVLDHALAMQRL